MNFNFLLATANGIIPATTTPSSNFDWRPIIYSIILCLVTAIIQWWFNWRKGASKRDTNHFIAFMDESAEFREEMRKDRERLKSEVESMSKERNVLKTKLLEYEKRYEECSQIVNKHTIELTEARKQIVILQEDISGLQAKITKLKEALQIVHKE